MTYTCQNCGSTADNPSTLCNPATEELERTVCTTSTDQVCEEKRPAMHYTCDTCGGMSPDAEHLCNPRIIE